jgi:hypothetical protein
MAIGCGDEGIDIMGIEYKNQIKILGISFHPHTHKTITDNWTQITRNIRLQASESYKRNLSMSHRSLYTYVPPVTSVVRDTNTAPAETTTPN